MEAFDDTWHWTPETEAEWQRLVYGTEYYVPPTLSKGMDALRLMLGENDVMAYLVMMTPRLLKIHRVLKDTGSMYLHCDPTASHYLKLICDQIFYPTNFRNEIVWKRASTIKGNFGQGAAHGLCADTAGVNTDELLDRAIEDRWTGFGRDGPTGRVDDHRRTGLPLTVRLSMRNAGSGAVDRAPPQNVGRVPQRRLERLR